MFRFGGWATLSHTATTIYQAMDPIILNRLAAAVDVASFHLGGLVLRQVTPLLLDVTTPIQPVMTSLHARGKVAEVENLYMRTGKHTLWMLGAVACPAIALRVPLFQLYLGERFEVYGAAPDVLVLMLAACVPYFSLIGLPRLAFAAARMRAYVVCNMVGQATNLGLTICLISIFKLGAYGSALSSLVTSWLLFAFALLPLSTHVFGMSLGRYMKECLTLGLVPWAVQFLVLAGMVQYVDSWITMFCVCCLGSAAYAACVFALLCRSERQDILRVLARVCGKAG
jgi:O-antigen/teichoic acid export membrane protein